MKPCITCKYREMPAGICSGINKKTNEHHECTHPKSMKHNRYDEEEYRKCYIMRTPVVGKCNDGKLWEDCDKRTDNKYTGDNVWVDYNR